MPDLDHLNNLSESEAIREFLKCCGSRNWAHQMVARRPFASRDELLDVATKIWWEADHDDWLEAFRSHPKIGEKKAAAEVSSQAASWSGQEQAGVRDSDGETLDELASLNWLYESKFGYIFIVCASGKTAPEMLNLLKARIDSNPETEIRIAAGEQAKITEIRLRKLLGEE